MDIGGRRLFAAVAGQGAPPAVFDGSRRRWGDVVRRTAEFTTVVTYDRANAGRSDPAPPGGTARDGVAELRALLRALEVPPPYVLVGHSWAGAAALSRHRCPSVWGRSGDGAGKLGPAARPRCAPARRNS